MLKLGMALDGLLCDTEIARKRWEVHLGYDFQEDESFWAMIPAYSDAKNSLQLAYKKFEVFVLSERHKNCALVTRAWIKNNCGILLDKDHLVMQTLKRYDCRLLGIDAFIDSNADALENLKIETVRPVRTYHVDRARANGLLSVVEEIDG
jgi:hypothetical protein